MMDVEARISQLIQKGCVTPDCIRDVDPGEVCWAEPTGLVVAVVAEVVDGLIQIWINQANEVELPLTCDLMVMGRGRPAAIIWEGDPGRHTRNQGESYFAPVSVVTNDFWPIRARKRFSGTYAMFDGA